MIDWTKITDVTPAQANRASQYDKWEYAYCLAVLQVALRDIEYACLKIRYMDELAETRDMLNDMVSDIDLHSSTVEYETDCGTVETPQNKAFNEKGEDDGE